MSEWISFFGSPDLETNLAGGKAANLHRLTLAGMPVPPGFVITSAALRVFLEANGLEPRILALYRSARPDDPASAEDAARAIRCLFDQTALAGDIAAEVESAYGELCKRSRRTIRVAVRSSAAAEDSAEASFAGQHDSYLNVGGQDLAARVKSCWASLWTARSIVYRARHNDLAGSEALAVVVQQFVRAEASGVTFTANPLTGARDEVVVNAVWGLGEALVSGLVTPDNFLLDKETGRLKQIALGDKSIETAPSEEGTAMRPVAARRAAARVLNDNQLKRLALLGQSLEKTFGVPQDIEWCLADDEIHVVQSRPITALPPEIHWVAPGDRKWVHGGGAIELLTEPVSTLLETLFVPLFDSALHDWMKRLGIDDMFRWPLVLGVNGFLYACLDVRPRPRHIRGLVKDLLEHKNSTEQWPEELALYRAAVESVSRADLPDLSAAELLSRVEFLLRSALRYWIHLTMIAQPIYRRERRFIAFHSSIRTPSEPAAEVLLRGLEMRPMAAERSIYELARLTKESPDEARLRKRLHEHLNHFGHQIYSFDPMLPTLSEDPSPVLAAVRVYLDGKEPPAERSARLALERTAALKDLELRLSGRKLRKYRKLLDRAQRAAQLRENALFELGLAFKPMRQALLEMGRRLVLHNSISRSEDVFGLTRSELAAAAQVLDSGGAPASLQRFVEDRSAAWKRSQNLQPPAILPLGSKPKFWWKYVFPMPELRVQPDESVIQGLGVSPGKVTSTARVINHSAEMHRLNRGEVLVTHTTAPAWAPLFACAGALVTDLGGPLSHGSIVAREYGIPAVMGTGTGTRRIRDGQTVTVDGASGRVYLMEPERA
jgi:pyruvate,water dikinase